MAAAFEMPRRGRTVRVSAASVSALVVASAAALVAAVAVALGGAQHGMFGPRTSARLSANPVDGRSVQSGPEVDETDTLPRVHGTIRAV